VIPTTYLALGKGSMAEPRTELVICPECAMQAEMRGETIPDATQPKKKAPGMFVTTRPGASQRDVTGRAYVARITGS
jgi:hypothetical protein